MHARSGGLRTALCVSALLLVAAAAGAFLLADDAAGERAPTVAVVGDSLAWQADASIGDALSHAGYVAQVSVNPGHALSSPWAQSELKKDLRDMAVGIIVLETASNDSIQVARSKVPVSRYSELLESLLQAARGRCVVVVDAKVDVTPFYYEPADALAVNRVGSELAVRNSDERIVDWNQEAEAHPSWFDADHLHFTSRTPSATSASDPPPSEQTAGAKAFAQAIVAGVQSCRDLPS